MYPYPPFQGYPQPMFYVAPGYNPTEGQTSKSQLKKAKKAIKFYQSILDENKKKEGDKKKDEKKGFLANVGVPERAFAYTFLAPFVGIAFVAMFLQALTSLAEIAQNFAQHVIK